MPDFKFLPFKLRFVAMLLAPLPALHTAHAASPTEREIGPQTSTLRPEYATVSKPEYSGVQSLQWRNDEKGDSGLPTFSSDGDVWQRIRNGFKFSEIHNPLTAQHEAWYAARPEYVNRMIERSRRYLFHIVNEVERRGMPMEIVLLPMIESAFNPTAYSTSHASGIWQFIPSTGRHYGLKQDHWYDGRRDITAATSAALDYLAKLYQDFGDWQLALAAYNCGEGCVGRAVRKNAQMGLASDYASLSLPTETRHYVPKLLAVKKLILDPASFGVALDVLPNQPYFTQVEVNETMDVNSAARLANMNVEDFTALNPAFSRKLIRSDTPVNILVPVDKTDHFQHSLKKGDWDTWTTYQARKGDRLETLAARFDTTEARLKEHNRFTLKRGKLASAQTILVPIKGRGVIKDATPAAETMQVAAPASAVAPDPKLHTVVAGDTLYSIARRYNTSVSALKLANPAVIYSVQVGQILLLPSHAVEPGASQNTVVAETPVQKVAFNAKVRSKGKPRYYTIKRGDTLHSVARLFDVDLSALKNWNPKLGKSRGIQPGKRIVVGMN